MKLNLITLATVKAQLGISDSTYDTAITAMIPIVSNDVRRILNTNYDNYIYASITDTEATITMSEGINDLYTQRIEQPHFNMGQVLVNTACIPDDTYIISYEPLTAVYTLSAAATADGTFAYPSIQISQWPAISKMIFYKISKQETTAASQQTLSSVRYGNVSKTFGPGEINKKYDYPQIFINELGTPYAKVG